MNIKSTVAILATGLALYMFAPESLPFSIGGMLIGLVIVVMIGEPYLLTL